MVKCCLTGLVGKFAGNTFDYICLEMALESEMCLLIVISRVCCKFLINERIQ